ncbi:hypothetical protein GW17_00055771 [Ensete ventricosum]|nr:hypothetical protein GW17_00055771 [Ensete ventricosum]
MGLNRVESFYAFLLRFRSEGSPCKGQPGMATTSPLDGAVGHLQGGDRLQPRPPCKGAATRKGSSSAGTTGCGQPVRGCRQWPGHKGLLLAARPQGAAAREVLPEGSNACRKGGCPCRRRAAPPPAQGNSGDGLLYISSNLTYDVMCM